MIYLDQQKFVVVSPKAIRRSAIEEYAAKKSAAITAVIDHEIAILLLPKPWWMPAFVYNSVVRRTVEITHFL